MRALRLLGLVPVFVGVVLIAIAGVKIYAVQANLCSFATSFLAQLGTKFAEACFNGAPAWSPYVAAAVLVLIGLVFLLLPETTGEKARLSVIGPRLHQYPPQTAQTTHFCRMRVRNRGPASARNVRIQLLNIEPRPRHGSWTGDYPYPVARVGQPIEAAACELGRGADELFQIAAGWKNTRGDFMAGLDTKSGFHNPTPIEPDECWEMTYEVVADNAAPIKFQLEMFVKGGAIEMKKKGWGRPQVMA
jgi:hypothetical protein